MGGTSAILMGPLEAILGESYTVFCIRNTEGDFIYASASSILDTTNIFDEAKSIQDAKGIEYMRGQDLMMLWTRSPILLVLLVAPYLEGSYDSRQAPQVSSHNPLGYGGYSGHLGSC
ncbi:hypothetical protein HAX54_021774 [Datura stramonium]|uniref:Uncharacterized protein n=1 Tax=Datura stramonium TaxID=4076 RepID=A0ABS8UU08_DATST|nr:hypothetical protein [Datura stramonium]